MEPILKIKNLNYQTGKKFLLKDINWEIQDGEHCLLFGRNGCGKTTLCSIVAGVKTQTSGTVQLFGESYTQENIFQLRRQVGWVSNSFYEKIYRHEKVSDIILAGKTGMLGLNFYIGDDDVKKMKQLLKEFQIESKGALPYSLLSKGEQQKVLLARAFMGDARLLILDEPCNGLDVLAREHLFQQIETIAERKEQTIIYITHYPEEISPAMQNCVLLSNGRIHLQGALHDVFTSEHLTALLGEPVSVYQANDRYQMNC